MHLDARARIKSQSSLPLRGATRNQNNGVEIDCVSAKTLAISAAFQSRFQRAESLSAQIKAPGSIKDHRR
jgi:hypothetical protein